MTEKELIIRLIADDLIHHGLIENFESIGFYSDDYCLDLSDTIFNYLKIDSEELYEKYLKKCSRIAQQRMFIDRKTLRDKAESIYEFLMQNINTSNT